MILLSGLIPDAKYKLFVDLDGTLTDFDRMFYEIKGITPAEFRTKHPEDKDDTKFWFIIDREGGLNFWSHMFWMPDGKMLWDYIKNKNVEILSAPARQIPEHSALGKKLWCGRFLGKNIVLNLTRASEKQKFAAPNHILIDDMKKNIERWQKAGGIGILHKSASETIGSLIELGIK